MLNYKVKTFFGVFFALALMLIIAPVQANAANFDPRLDDTYGQEVRVLLEGYSGATSYTIEIESGTYDIIEYDNPGVVLDTVSSGNIIFTFSGSYPNFNYSYSTGGDSGTVNSPLLAVPRSNDANFEFKGTDYRGCFKVIHGSTTFCAVNQIYVELYLYGVVGRELGYNYNMDATMAQAVAARSYALANYSSSNTYYDLRADTYSQVYGGKSAETSKIIQSVDDTRGWALKYNGKYVQTYYSSNMGGYSENIENVWVSSSIPIKGVPSPHDSMAGDYSSYGASTYSWVVEYTPEELVAKANSYGSTNIGEYRSISYSTTYNGQTSVSDRAMIVTITGSDGSVSATKNNIRSLLDLKSSKVTIVDETQSDTLAYIKGANTSAIDFDNLDDVYAIGDGGGTMTINGSYDSVFIRGADHFVEIDKNNAAGDKIVVTGYGYGHGVGLSQFGAIGMGDDGYEWDEIVEHYFCNGTGITLLDVY